MLFLHQVAALAEQLRPDDEVDKELEQLRAEWKKLEDATETRGKWGALLANWLVIGIGFISVHRTIGVNKMNT